MHVLPSLFLLRFLLRDWANEQFAKLDEIAKRTEATLVDRQLVESFTDRPGPGRSLTKPKRQRWRRSAVVRRA